MTGVLMEASAIRGTWLRAATDSPTARVGAEDNGPARQVAPLVNQLRQLLPGNIELWVGGAGAQRVSAQPGTVLLASLTAALDAVKAWRENASGEQ